MIVAHLLVAWSISGGAQAQSPQWHVIVTPTLNPLPIGLCGAVQVTVLDAAAMDMPRNPLGARVTIADFDMTVAAPGARSVVGQQIDASHWSVCACSGAPVGGVATVTATYPARALPAAARVAGASFTSTATVFIAAAKGTSPPACLAAPPAAANTGAAKAVSAPAPAARNATAAANAPTSVPATSPATAPATGAPNNSKQSSSPNSQPANAPSPPPGLPAQIPGFPASAADWAALQKSLGSKGWADLQKETNAAMDETPDNTDDKPPPGVPKEMMGTGRNHAAAVAAFKKLAPVLRHARCANCHTDITYWDDPGEGGDPPRPATHKGGDINELPPTAKNGYGQPDLKFTPCQDCHIKAPVAWKNSGPDWTGLDDYQLCQKLKQAMFNGEVLLDHLRTDDLIKLAFQGQRAMDLTPQPPPLSHTQFMQYATEWINRMDAMKKFPKARSEGCPRNDSWSGAIEYTYTEVSKLNRYESHGVVHVVGGLAKWSALAARQEDHSAKNCPSVYSASASGGGEMQLVTIDYTSEKGVSGISMANLQPKPGAVAPDSFVGLTIFPGRYGLSIDLPMKGSGRYQGGGPACPGYRSITQVFDAKIGQGADGKFDPDNPDELSGTKTESPFPGATFTMKWQFMRLNEDWSR
jgi:hypothetical protein